MTLPLSDLPREKGVYVLLLHLPRKRTIAIGALGAFDFPRGYYAYTGSAWGSAGIAGRIARQFRSSRTRRWHIDYLRAHSRPVGVWCFAAPRRHEHVLAAALDKACGASCPAPRFGASDCRCRTHLVRFPVQPDIQRIAETVDAAGVVGRYVPVRS